MCLAACYWAKLDNIYYAAELEEAAKFGFDSSHIYDFWKDMTSKNTKIEQVVYEGYLKPFQHWKNVTKINPFEGILKS